MWGEKRNAQTLHLHETDMNPLILFPEGKQHKHNFKMFISVSLKFTQEFVHLQTALFSCFSCTLVVHA